MKIGIIGGGFSGSLVAVHLLKRAGPISVSLIEPRSDLARGLAYSTACPDHLLNVPAWNMSALPSHPSQFHEWLRSNGYPDAGPDFFAARQVYGKYLKNILNSAIESRPGGFRPHFAEAVAFDYASSGAIGLTLSDGTLLELDRLILAIGNPPAKRLAINGLDSGPDRYFNSPFEKGALERLQTDRPVLLVGSGLTAVDAAVALRSQGHCGVVYMVSRRGQRPHPHLDCQPGCPQSPLDPGLPLRAMVRAVRAAANGAADWRTAIDALRPISNQIWRGFTTREKRQFARHLKVYWDVHRHRMAPQFGVLMGQAERSGEVEVIAGRLRRVSAKGECILAEIALRSGPERTVAVSRIINCTGPDYDYRRSAGPLLQSLFQRGLALPGALGTGLRTTEHGALMDAQGRPSPRLFTIGPPRTGEVFETVAVPEIRVQAAALAAHVMASAV